MSNPGNQPQNSPPPPSNDDDDKADGSKQNQTDQGTATPSNDPPNPRIKNY